MAQKAFCICLILASLFAFCNRQTLSVEPAGPGRIIARTIRVDGRTYSYYVYLPIQYTTDKKWPVLLYLHGSGEDGNIQRISGHLGWAINRNPERFPCLIVFPHCPLSDYWIGSMIAKAVQCLNRCVTEFNGDSNRLYVSGVSMGGYGSYIAAVQNPGKFAAVAPVCGGVIPPVRFTVRQQKKLGPVCQQILSASNPYAALASLLGKTPVWLFHGSADALVPVTESRNIASALRAGGGNVQYSEFEGMGHDIGQAVYCNTNFLNWLLSRENTH